MENATFCPIDYQLSKIIASSNSNPEALEVLDILEQLILNLLLSPFDEKQKQLKKGCPLLDKNFLSIEGVKEFLLFIGYQENESDFVHRTCDENMKILEQASKVITYHTNQLKLEDSSSRQEYKEKEIEKKNTGKAGSKNGGIFGRFCCKKELEPCKLSSFLMKHFKKDDTAVPATNKFQNKSTSSPGYSFNSEGYFHQSCAERQAMKKKDPRVEIFDKHEPVMKKERCSFFSFAKKK